MRTMYTVHIYMLLFLLVLFVSSFATWESGGRRVPAVEYEDSLIGLDTPKLDRESAALDSGLTAKNNCHWDSLSSDTNDFYKKIQLTGVSILQTPKVWGSNHDTILLNTLMYNRQNLESIEFFSDENLDAFIHRSFGNPYSFGASLWLIVPSVITTLFLSLYADLAYVEKLVNPNEGETVILLCGFAGCGISFSFGVAKMRKHFSWKSRYGE